MSSPPCRGFLLIKSPHIGTGVQNEHSCLSPGPYPEVTRWPPGCSGCSEHPTSSYCPATRSICHMVPSAPWQSAPSWLDSPCQAGIGWRRIPLSLMVMGNIPCPPLKPSFHTLYSINKVEGLWSPVTGNEELGQR